MIHVCISTYAQFGCKVNHAHFALLAKGKSVPWYVAMTAVVCTVAMHEDNWVNQIVICAAEHKRLH